MPTFPTPRDITDIRSCFGLVNQVAYAFASAEKMLPFRSLLKPGTTFRWTEELNTLFEECKDIIISEITKGVEIFDKSRPTCLALTGVSPELVFGCYKNIVTVLHLTHFAANPAGESHLWEADSPLLQSPATNQWKVKL